MNGYSCATGTSTSAILIAKCTNSLSTCTAPVALEATLGTGSARDFVQLSHLTISPANGKVYVTWGKHSGTTLANEQVQVRLRVITPTSLTTSVGTLGLLRTVHIETLPIPFGTFPYPAFHRTATYPHIAVKGSRAIIVWDRRSVSNIIGSSPTFFFFNADILAKFTDDDGVNFSALQSVSAASGPQYQPSICVDNTSGTVGVAYFSHQNDPIFAHKQDVYLATSATGAAPYTPLRVTSGANDTEADLLLSDTFIGDYIEVACRGGVGLIHYTANYLAKPTSIFIGGSATLLVRQQDTFLGKVTLP